MKLRVVPADPAAVTGAKVIDLETGKELEEVSCITYSHRAGDVARVTVETLLHRYGPMSPIDGEAVGEGKIEQRFFLHPADPPISLNDQLPKLGEKVLVFVTGWGWTVGWREIPNGAAVWQWCSSDAELGYQDDSLATHWCPLPPAPIGR